MSTIGFPLLVSRKGLFALEMTKDLEIIILAFPIFISLGQSDEYILDILMVKCPPDILDST